MSVEPERRQGADLASTRNPFFRFAFWSLLAAWTAAGLWGISRHGFRATLALGARYLVLLSIASLVLLLVYAIYRLGRLIYQFRR